MAKKLYLEMTEGQAEEVEKFLSDNEIFKGGGKEFGLIADILINDWEISIRLVSPEKHKTIRELLQKLGIK